MLKKVSSLLFVFLGCFLICLPIASAQIAGEGLTISPPLAELTINAGESSTQTIQITNPGTKSMEVYPLVMDFRAKGETGEPEFYLPSKGEEKFFLSSWIKFSQSKISINPGQLVDFTYQINIPKDAEPGGHYGTIFFATQPPELGKGVSQVAITSMVGSLLLVKVPGVITESGTLQEFSVKKFYLKPPVVFTVKIANLGNIHFKPQGEITIKNWRGKEIDKLSINQTGGNVLPNSVRKFEEKYDPNKTLVGRYSADLRVVYGAEGKVLTGELMFWVLPWWAIAIAVIVLALIIAAIVKLVRK
jgi:hypothetical protein